uniref:RNA polymerase II-associated factor 1 homolog n=1 Tax=Rhodnius prolixus TaxID=13249 RepID=A0A4P6D7S0_RHOPR
MSPTVPTNVNVEKRSSLLKPGTTERRSELVCRVKYCNTLPDIPFDPKFITYPFESTRFIEYKPTSLERHYKYEVLTEHDLGVTIDLINKDMYAADPHAQLDPADEKLLEEDILTPHDSKRSRHHSRSVSWLRRTEYISTEQTRFQPQTMDKVEAKVGYSIKKSLKEETLYLDRENQIKAIEKTFEDAKKPIEKHYSKPNVVPVEILPIFPDFKLWKYPCAQVMFDSDPAPVGRPVPAQLEEMSQAMIRGVMDESGEQFVAYFLPTESTLEKRRRDFTNGVDYEDEEEYEYKIAREYNWNVKTKASKGYEENYFLVVRTDGVYFNELETRVRLSKRRQRAGQAPNNTRLVVRHRPMDANEFNIHRQREKQLEPHIEEEEEEEDDEEEEEQKEKKAEENEETQAKSSASSDNESEGEKADAESDSEKEHSDKEGSDKEGSDKEGSGKDDSDKEGSDKDGSDKEGSDKEESNKEGSDKEESDKGKSSDREGSDQDRSEGSGGGADSGGEESDKGSGAANTNKSSEDEGSDSDRGGGGGSGSGSQGSSKSSQSGSDDDDEE